MFQFAQRMSVFTLTAFGLYAQTTTTPPIQATLSTGMVGIAEGQTAQLNALNPDEAAGAACTGLLTFLGDDGKVLKSMTIPVAAGTSGHIAIDSVIDLALAVGARKEIRATLAIPPVPPPIGSSTTAVTPVCKLIGTLEIFNTLDGHTLVTLGTVHRVPTGAATPGS
jgi:hypothetical protein